MKEFDELLDSMWAALMDAREMAMEAYTHKTDYPDIASVCYRIAGDRLNHVEMLRKAAVDLRDHCVRNNSDDADEMTVLLSHDNGRIAAQAAEIRKIMEMYR